MQSKQCGRVHVLRQGVLVSHQSHRLQESCQVCVFHHHLAQLQHIFPAVLAFFAIILNIGLVSCIFDDAVKEDYWRVILGNMAPLCKLPAKLFQSRAFPAQGSEQFSAVGLAQAQYCLAQGHFTRARQLS